MQTEYSGNQRQEPSRLERPVQPVDAARIDQYVGSRVRAARRIRGINQGQLAERLGLTPQQVQKYESGQNRISASRLYLMARLLGVPVGFFFEGLPTGPRLWQWLASDDPVEGADDEALRHRENQDIVAAFERIEDPKTRRRILTIMADIAAFYSPDQPRTSGEAGPSQKKAALG